MTRQGGDTGRGRGGRHRPPPRGGPTATTATAGTTDPARSSRPPLPVSALVAYVALAILFSWSW